MKSSDFDWSMVNEVLLSRDGEGGGFALFGVLFARDCDDD